MVRCAYRGGGGGGVDVGDPQRILGVSPSTINKALHGLMASVSSKVKVTKLTITATVVKQNIPELPTTLIIYLVSYKFHRG